MTDDGRIACVKTCHAWMESGKPMSKDSFISDFCQPMRHVEQWLAKKRKDYGGLANQPSFRRMAQHLMEGKYRVEVLACMKIGLRLEGVSEEQPGIHMCRVCILALEEMKNRDTSGVSGDAAAGPPANAQGPTSGNTSGVSGDASGVSGGAPMAVADGTIEVDPIEIATNAKVDGALQNHHCYRTFAELQDNLPVHVVSTHKMFFLIDCPTSKIKIGYNLVDKLVEVLRRMPTDKIKMYLPCGDRLDFCASMRDKLKTSFPGMFTYMIQISRGDTQTDLYQPHYGIFAASLAALGGVKKVCASVPALTCKAERGEGTRLRCTDKMCPLRPADELQRLMALAGQDDTTDLRADCEMNADDTEGVIDAGGGDVMEEPEEGDDREEEGEQLIAPPSKKMMVVDLWPFAFPRQYYKHIYQALNGDQGMPNHIVIITTSAHPSSVLAALDLKVPSHLVQDRVNSHCQAHGEQLLRHTLFKENYKIEKEKAPAANKRVRPASLFFVDVTAPAEQAVRFTETSPDESKSGWRAGYCQYPAEDFLETAVPQLLAWELDNVPVTIRASNNASVAGNVLTASRALKEGEVVMTARCLTFSDATMVAQFMNSGGNGALLEGPLIAVRGVEGCDGDGATTFMDVHCVLVGLARMIKDYRGLRKRPNVAFRARPERGANDGFLEVVVSTPNAVGIGANSEIVANFGEHYVPSSEVYNPSAKKFKGALDLLLEKQAEKSKQHDDASAANDDASAADAAQAGAGAGSAGTAGKVGGVATATAGGVATAGKAGGADAAMASGSGGPNVEGGGNKDQPADVTLATGEILFFTVSNPGYAGVLDSSGEFVLRRFTKVGKNFKIPKHTCMYACRQGECVEPKASGGAGPAFSFSKPKDLVVDSKTQSVTTIGEMIKKYKAEKLFAHGPFTKGAAPTQLSVKKTMTFQAKAEGEPSLNKLLESLAKATKIKLLWLCGVKDSKIIPQGLAVVSMQQLTLTTKDMQGS